jgi:hypothetical protein
MKSSRKNISLKMLLLPLLACTGLMLFANGFDISTVLSNTVEFAERIISTTDGTQSGTKVMDINT